MANVMPGIVSAGLRDRAKQQGRWDGVAWYRILPEWADQYIDDQRQRSGSAIARQIATDDRGGITVHSEPGTRRAGRQSRASG
jgi:hypothetical protein